MNPDWGAPRVLLAVIGIAYGSALGLLENWILFRKMAANRRAGVEPLRGVGLVFFLRYILDVGALFAFGYLVKDKWAIMAAAFSLTVAVKISLFIVYTRKGGKFD